MGAPAAVGIDVGAEHLHVIGVDETGGLVLVDVVRPSDLSPLIHSLYTICVTDFRTQPGRLVAREHVAGARVDSLDRDLEFAVVLVRDAGWARTAPRWSW
jgi:hypothetical protein